MPRLHKIVTLFDDDGDGAPTVRREYKVVDGVEFEVTAEDRQALYGVASANGAAAIAAARAAQTQAENERDALQAQIDAAG